MAATSVDLANQESLKEELQHSQSPTQFQLLADLLLGNFLDVWFVGAAAGSQHGADSGTAGQQGRRLRVECKRYRDTTKLSERQLLGELGQALSQDEALEAWILVATRSVPEQIQQSLVSHGERLGVPVVVIDWRIREIAPLAALCAAAPDIVEENLTRKAGKAARALQAVSGNEIDRLKRVLESWRLGYESLRQQSHDKLSKVWTSPTESNKTLNQDAAGGAEQKRIKRDAILDRLKDWWTGDACSGAPAAVVGLEGTGKTWSVLEWLVDGKAEQPIVMTIPSLAVGPKTSVSETSVKDFLAGWLREVSGVLRGPEYWLQRLDRLLKRPLVEGPLLTVFLDGLNQEPMGPWLPFLKVLQGEPFAGRVRLIVTTRKHYFENWLSELTGLSTPAVPVPVGYYDDHEIGLMLGHEGLTQEDLNPDVLKLARRPRLFKLVVRLRQNLVDSGQITVHRLLWEYGRDALGLRSGKSFSQKEWKEWLQSIALGHREGITQYSTKTLGDTVGRPDLTNSDVYRRLSDIIDGQFAIPTPSGNIHFSPEVMAHALGLALLNQLEEVDPPTFEALEGRLNQWLDPIAGLDQLPEILRAAVSIRVEQGLASSPVTGALLTAWLHAQNVTDEHRGEIIRLAPNFPGGLLDVIEQSANPAHESARSWAVTALQAIPRSNSDTLIFVVDRGRRWLNLVFRDIRNGPAADKEHNRRRSAQLKDRVGTDSAGPTTVVGVELELSDQDLGYAKATIPSIVQGFRLAEIMPILEAAATELAVVEYSSCWDSLKWLCFLNEVDQMETNARIRDLASEILQRQPEPGTHPDLPNRIAALLLRLTGDKVDEDFAARLEPNIGRGHSYEKDYLPQPGRSFWFHLERRHADIGLSNTNVALVPRIQRTEDLWVDPTFDPPAKFVAEVRQWAANFDVHKVMQSRGRTREDLEFEALQPVLARCAPDVLSDIVRRKMQDLANSQPESRYPKAMNVIDHLLLAGELEAAAAKTARVRGSEEDETNEMVAANWLSIMEIKDLDAHHQIDSLIQADLKDFLIDTGEMLRPLLSDKVEALIKHYRSDTEKRQLDLFKLLSFRPHLLREQEAWSWAAGFRKSHPDHRSSVFKTLAEADLIRFGQILQQEGWSWDSSQEEWVNHYGTDALIEASSSLSFEELAPRLAPWRILEAARRRGADPVEVRSAAEIFTRALLIPNVQHFDPGADLSIDRTGQKTLPFRYDVHARRSQNQRENFLLAFDSDAQLQTVRDAIDTATARIQEARNSGAILLHAPIDPRDFQPVFQHAPEKVDRWIEGHCQLTIDFQRRVRLAEGAFVALCEALLEHDPELGAKLWCALRRTLSTRYIAEAGVDDLIHMLFRVPESPATADLLNKATQLGHCHTDGELFDLAIAATCNNRLAWLSIFIKRDRESGYVWREQRAKILEGFTTNHCLPVAGAWPDREVKTMSAEITRVAARSKTLEACARHWWQLYLKAPDPVSAYAAWVLFLRSADRRSWVWINKDLGTDEKLDHFAGLKRANVHLNHNNLEHAMSKREEKSDQNFLCRRIKQDISPWSR